jgi:hypothetical protein
MIINDITKKYVTRDSIVNMLTRYELYYHISLGNFVLETIQDFDETIVKLKELDLQIKVDTALANIIEIIFHYSDQDDFDIKFEYHLRCRAILHALKDFVNKDKELINSQDYIEDKTKEIIDDTYFKETMKLQLESDYNFVYDYYDMIITDDIMSKIKSKLEQ